MPEDKGRMQSPSASKGQNHLLAKLLKPCIKDKMQLFSRMFVQTFNKGAKFTVIYMFIENHTGQSKKKKKKTEVQLSMGGD